MIVTSHTDPHSGIPHPGPPPCCCAHAERSPTSEQQPANRGPTGLPRPSPPVNHINQARLGNGRQTIIYIPSIPYTIVNSTLASPLLYGRVRDVSIPIAFYCREYSTPSFSGAVTVQRKLKRKCCVLCSLYARTVCFICSFYIHFALTGLTLLVVKTVMEVELWRAPMPPRYYVPLTAEIQTI